MPTISYEGQNFQPLNTNSLKATTEPDDVVLGSCAVELKPHNVNTDQCWPILGQTYLDDQIGTVEQPNQPPPVIYFGIDNFDDIHHGISGNSSAFERLPCLRDYIECKWFGSGVREGLWPNDVQPGFPGSDYETREIYWEIEASGTNELEAILKRYPVDDPDDYHQIGFVMMDSSYNPSHPSSMGTDLSWSWSAEATHLGYGDEMTLWERETITYDEPYPKNLPLGDAVLKNQLNRWILPGVEPRMTVYWIHFQGWDAPPRA